MKLGAWESGKRTAGDIGRPLRGAGHEARQREGRRLLRRGAHSGARGLPPGLLLAPVPDGGRVRLRHGEHRPAAPLGRPGLRRGRAGAATVPRDDGHVVNGCLPWLLEQAVKLQGDEQNWPV